MCTYTEIRFPCCQNVVRKATDICGEGVVSHPCEDWRPHDEEHKDIVANSPCPFCGITCKGCRAYSTNFPVFSHRGRVWHNERNLYWATGGYEECGMSRHGMCPHHRRTQSLLSLSRYYPTHYQGLRSLGGGEEDSDETEEERIERLARLKASGFYGLDSLMDSMDIMIMLAQAAASKKERIGLLDAMVLAGMKSGAEFARSQGQTKNQLESLPQAQRSTPRDPADMANGANTVALHVVTSQSPYQTLDRTSQQVRLLQLDPGETGSDLVLSFQHVNLQNCPPYTALSYTWGDEDILHRVRIRGFDDIGIRENLLTYLLMKRSTLTEPIFLWIDAVCINQAHVQERNHQVNMMKLIYANASKVDIWLGKEGEDSHLAISHINARARRPLEPSGFGFKTIWSDRVGAAICDLCERPYWRRMWIVQEVCHAEDITVWCGNDSFAWSTLEALYLKLKGLEDSSWFAHHRYAMRVLQSSACVMIWQRAHWQHKDTPVPSLRTLIEVFSTWRCSDVRDKVYALISMADPETAVTPDYNKTATDIYHEVADMTGRDDQRWCKLLARVLAIPYSKLDMNGHSNWCYGSDYNSRMTVGSDTRTASCVLFLIRTPVPPVDSSWPLRGRLWSASRIAPFGNPITEQMTAL